MDTPFSEFFADVVYYDRQIKQINIADEELYQNVLAQFGSACRHMPSMVPQQLSASVDRYGHLLLS
tara:strand:+ start:883 stop:1080 length:198 start_codon:yes stop_codon:yes gene_type:complete